MTGTGIANHDHWMDCCIPGQSYTTLISSKNDVIWCHALLRSSGLRAERRDLHTRAGQAQASDPGGTFRLERHCECKMAAAIRTIRSRSCIEGE
jgi:hypothetical protein